MRKEKTTELKWISSLLYPESREQLVYDNFYVKLLTRVILSELWNIPNFVVRFTVNLSKQLFVFLIHLLMMVLKHKYTTES